MARPDDPARLLAFCCAAAIAAACSGNPSVTTPPGAFGGMDNSGGTGASAAVANSGNAATGNLMTDAGDGPGTVMVYDAKALAFDPLSVTLTLGDAGALKTASYVLKATLEDKSKVAVAAESLEFDRPDLASFE